MRHILFSAIAVGLFLAPVQGVSAQPTEFTNTIGITFIPFPAGSFLMGSADTGPDAQRAEQPQHEVSISKGFLIGR